ncbi:MAG: hypothetical protein ACRBHB_24195 [Arenicella sp.]
MGKPSHMVLDKTEPFIIVDKASGTLPWINELSAAVEDQSFVVPRVEIGHASADQIATWLDKNLPRQPISGSTRDALLSDVLRLLYFVEIKTAATRFKLRLFTEKPCRRCGFHVDTVRPGAPVWGGLKIYNGNGVDWVQPAEIISMQHFYQWLEARDFIVRKYTADQLLCHEKLQVLDQELTFLTDEATIQHINAGTMVLFKHIPADKLWGDHNTDMAWVHCSPMQGKTRLVVNISADPYPTPFSVA